MTLLRDEYTRMALVYDERVVPRFAPIAAATVARAALRPGERVLDVGCGTGLATLLAAEAVGPAGAVVGLDASEGQLGIAAGKAQLRGLAHVAFVRGDTTKLAERAAYDAVLSNFGLPVAWEAALPALHAALRPGGRFSLVAWDYRPGQNPMFDSFRALLAKHMVSDPDPELGAVRAETRASRSAFERLGSPGVLQAALATAGFRDVLVEGVTYPIALGTGRGVFDFMTAWGAAEREVRALTGEEREALLRECAAAFPAPYVAAWSVLHATARG